MSCSRLEAPLLHTLPEVVLLFVGERLRLLYFPKETFNTVDPAVGKGNGLLVLLHERLVKG